MVLKTLALYLAFNLRCCSMSRLILFFILCGFAFTACSQNPTNNPSANKPGAATTPAKTTAAPAPAAQPAAVYASEKAGWLVDLDEAYEKSQKEGKPILANFTGSDWCSWCKKLDADVFSKPEFQSWAKENVVLLELDFPRRKQIPQKNMSQNAGMQQALRITGYPTVYLLTMSKDPNSGQYQVNALGKTGYTPDAKQFISTIKSYMKG